MPEYWMRISDWSSDVCSSDLLETLKRLRHLGNTVLVVEHDEDAIRTADYIVDMGPGAGVHGGEVVAEGALDDIIGNEASITGDYLAGRREVPVPIRRRKGSGKFLSAKGARARSAERRGGKEGVRTCRYRWGTSH